MHSFSRDHSKHGPKLLQIEAPSTQQVPRAMPLIDPVTMSSTMVKDTSTQGADTKSKLAISPVPINDSPLSKSIALIRPVLLLGLLGLRFDALVAEPVSTLQLALPAVAVIQAAYAITCLPVAGSQTTKVTKKSRPGEKKKADASSPNSISVRKGTRNLFPRMKVFKAGFGFG